MKFLRPGVLFVCMSIASPRAATADVIGEWSDRAIDAGYRSGLVYPVQSRNVALVDAAMFDAVNSIASRYSPYRVQLTATQGTSQEAAAVAAAHYLLVRLHHDLKDEMDAAFNASLATMAAAPGKARGIELGERVAAAILDDRKSDGADAPNVYRPFTTSGTYVPTVFPIVTNWGGVKPWVLKSGSQFRPPAPYSLASAQWAKDYDEVRRFGAKTGSLRSAEQTGIALFWELTGPATFFPFVRQLAAAKQLDLVDHARLSALVALATADAAIAVLDAKYTYNFWRPVTAIRNGDIDTNDATARDAGWQPLIETPLHPEYPCAHCISSSATAGVLEALFGAALPPLTLTGRSAPVVIRRFARLSDYMAEVINARVYDGVHYRTSGEVGSAMGRQIGAYVVQHSLRPIAATPKTR